MHELALIGNIIEIVREELPRHDLRKVTRISLRIGVMRQVVPAALQFGFKCLSKDTPLEGAELDVEAVPMRGKCEVCTYEFEMPDWTSACPCCCSHKIKIIAGQELDLMAFEGE